MIMTAVDEDTVKMPVSAGSTAASPNWRRLVGKICTGDPVGMEELYGVFSRGVRFYLCRQLGPQELEDKVHDTFLIVVQAIRRGELREPDRLMGFVRTIVRRLTPPPEIADVKGKDAWKLPQVIISNIDEVCEPEREHVPSCWKVISATQRFRVDLRILGAVVRRVRVSRRGLAAGGSRPARPRRHPTLRPAFEHSFRGMPTMVRA